MTLIESISRSVSSRICSAKTFFRIIIAGPNDDFSFLAEEFATGATWTDGNWEYTFNTPIPADAEGSFTAGAELFEMVPVWEIH